MQQMVRNTVCKDSEGTSRCDVCKVRFAMKRSYHMQAVVKVAVSAGDLTKQVNRLLILLFTVTSVMQR